MKLHWYIATRYLKSKRKESFISFISGFSTVGICLGVAVLIIVMSVMNGFKKDIVKSLIGTNSHIYINSYSNTMYNYDSVIGYIKSSDIPNIKQISPTISEQVLLTYQKTSNGTVLSSMTLDDLKSRDLLYKSVNKYDLSKFQDNDNVIILGAPLARYLGVKVGDHVSVVSPNGYVTILGSVPSVASFQVIAIASTGLYQYDSALAIIPFYKAQSFFRYKANQSQNIEIQLDDPFSVDKTALLLSKILKNLNVTTWVTNNQYLMNALSVERNVMFLILSLVILIAAFNIVSSLIMLVRSKTKEVSVLKTMGMLNKDIVLIFMLIGIRIGLKGTLIGGALGSIIALNLESIKKFLEKLVGIRLFPEEVYFLSQLPSDIQLPQVLSIMGLSLFMAIIATIYPSIQASKINPARGIKYE